MGGKKKITGPKHQKKEETPNTGHPPQKSTATTVFKNFQKLGGGKNPRGLALLKGACTKGGTLKQCSRGEGRCRKEKKKGVREKG